VRAWASAGYFSGVAKSGEIFLPFETKKTIFFAKMFKIQGGPRPHLPTPIVGEKHAYVGKGWGEQLKKLEIEDIRKNRDSKSILQTSDKHINENQEEV